MLVMFDGAVFAEKGSEKQLLTQNLIRGGFSPELFASRRG